MAPPERVPGLAGGGLPELAEALRRHASEATCVAVVGHEPDLSEWLGRLIGCGTSERLTFRKGGMALVELPGEAAEGGRLLFYLNPRVLRRLGR